jgi:predicted DNA-binding ribbon-helix-helix protein
LKVREILFENVQTSFGEKYMGIHELSERSDKEAQSTLVSRNIYVSGRRTSIRLEPVMWIALRDIVDREKCNMHDLCSLIELRKDKNTSLTAAIRAFTILYFRAAATEEGHQRVGHGDFTSMLKRARMTRESFGGNKHEEQGEPPTSNHTGKPRPN